MRGSRAIFGVSGGSWAIFGESGESRAIFGESGGRGLFFGGDCAIFLGGGHGASNDIHGVPSDVHGAPSECVHHLSILQPGNKFLNFEIVSTSKMYSTFAIFNFGISF